MISMREDHSFHVRYRMEASCLELALEGERLCKSGDCRAGVSFLKPQFKLELKTSKHSVLFTANWAMLTSTCMTTPKR